MELILIGLVFFLGASLGSFAGVLAHRLPRGESVVSPPSHCEGCGKSLTPGELIPVISFLWLRGRCKVCGQWIGWGAWLGEMVLGAYAVALFLWVPQWGEFARALVLGTLLWPISLVDLRLRLIPNKLSLPGIVLGLALSLLPGGLGILRSALGVVVGGGVLLLVHLIKPEGMGLGDVKLLAMLGAFVGWDGAVLTIFLGSVLGAITGLTGIALGKISSRKASIPFGPFLAVAGLVAFFYREWIWWIWLGI